MFIERCVETFRTPSGVPEISICFWVPFILIGNWR